MNFPKNLEDKILERHKDMSFRRLEPQSDLIDFYSNDYIGFAKSEVIFDKTHRFLVENNCKLNGATGSRLLSGNHFLYNQVEELLCEFHNSESALIFNSGYSANMGFFWSVPSRDDVILYDQYSHASIRDGIVLSKARAYKFKHNYLIDLERQLIKHSKNQGNIYVVTESVFSMDGDSPDLVAMVELCEKYRAYFIVDQAHSVGVFGRNGAGLIQELGLEDAFFARIITFGKAMGTHGAAIIGSQKLKQYLLNFARSFIYTTALPPHCLANIKIAYLELSAQNKDSEQKKLEENVQFFKSELNRKNLKSYFIDSNSAIHCCVVQGNKNSKLIADKLQRQGFAVKPILSPTVPKQQERLRFCLHSYNSKREIEQVLSSLSVLLDCGLNLRG